MAIEPIKGFYVHDEATDTDGVAKYDANELAGDITELADIRMGADGVEYPSAGGAVRGQIEKLSLTEYALDALEHVTGQYINEAGEHSSANFEYYVYAIPKNCTKIKFETNMYGPGRVVLTTTSSPSNILTNPYICYPETSFSVATDYNETIDCAGYKYIFVTHYVGDAKPVKTYAYLNDRIDTTSESLAKLKEKQAGVMSGEDVNITNDKYINYENGVMGTSAGAGATDYIPVISNSTYELNLPTSIYTDSRGVAFYKDGTFLSGTGIRYIIGTTTYRFAIPDGANQMRLTVRLTDADDKYFSLVAVTNLKELTQIVNNAINDKIPEPVPNLFAFNTVGIVGDSLASGCSNYKDEQNIWHALDRKAFAWGKFLEKRQGCTVTLFSQGGMTTQLWFTNANGYTKAQNNPCECYYIGLGVNDYSSLGADYLGTVDDVHLGDEDLNADTFYGNYSKIIAKLTEIQPRCKIFCFTMPSDQSASTVRYNYDTAIRTVCGLYSNAYLLDLSNDTFYSSELVQSTYYGAHYLATGYSLMADHILEITNKYIREHLEDFADIQWITNNYPNSDIVL